MTRTYPAYMTVIWCMVVAFVVGFGAYDVGRRLGASAVRAEAIRAGAAYYDITTQDLSPLDHSRIINRAEFRWSTPKELRRAASHLEDRLVQLFPQLDGR